MTRADMTIPPDGQGADADLAMLLCTRLCHDLAGSVGAVSAGVELLGDDADAAFLGEAVALLRHSADASSARLKFLRATLGGGQSGARSGGPAPRGLVLGYADAVGGALKVDWRDHGGDESGPLGSGGGGRLLLNLCMTAFDCLGGSGTLIVEIQPTPDGGAGGRRFAVTAEGPRAAVEAPLRRALDGDRAGLGPRTAQGYLLSLLALPGGGLIVEEMPGRVLLAAGHRAAGDADVAMS